jgi:hypothetical protein
MDNRQDILCSEGTVRIALNVIVLVAQLAVRGAIYKDGNV